jgi:dTDP-glucose pyrophosphorylase
MTYKVLITTSGIGSRLGTFTRFTNKCLARVGDKPVIAHIVDMYPSNIEFVVTLGHFGNHVQEFLELSYPNRKFVFVLVENYEGPGSSLGKSLLHAQPFLQEPFIFHASDTLILNGMEIPNVDFNWVGGALGSDATQYTSFDISGEIISKFHPKGMIGFDFLHIGLVGIFDFHAFWESLSEILEKSEHDNSIGDVDALQAMKNRGYELRCLKIDNWFDTGSAGTLQRARNKCTQKYDVLEKANEAVFFLDEHVVKFFGDEEINRRRVMRSRILEGVVPPVVQHTKHFFKYPYQDGVELSKCVSNYEIQNLLKWSKTNLWVNRGGITEIQFQQICLNFYREKTWSRVESYLEKNEIEDSGGIINDLVVPSVRELLSQVDFDFVSKGVPSGFHGDFILDNILKTEDGYVLLDWRQDFGSELSMGDMYYDLAKLNHSFVINHEIVAEGKYEVIVSGDTVKCEIYRKHSFVEGQKTLFTYLETMELDKKKVEMITAIIWLNMATLHHHPFDQFLFNFGKYALWKAISNEN